jgi:RNA polymerase sigma-70 factor (ECF subfamily)
MDDDADLLARFAAGERGDAAGALFDQYSGRLYGLGLQLLGDRGLAEELVQETFVRLWRSAASFDPAKGSPSTFIFAIARRIAVDLWRRPSSRPFAPEPSDTAAPNDSIDNVIVAVSVRDALQCLTPPHREVLELSYFDGLKQREVAGTLGIPLGTVKTRTFHAMKALKQALTERGIDA